MKKFLKNLLAIIIIILMIFLITLSKCNISKAVDPVSSISVSILENGKIVADRSYDGDSWNEVNKMILTEIPR